MAGTDDVLAALSAAVDDRAVSLDAMRSGPAVVPDPAEQPLVVALLLAAAGQLDASGLRVPEHQLVRAQELVAAIIATLGPPG